MRRWIHFQVLILLSLTVFSQDRYTFERFDASRGLSEDHVIAMLQDREGFLWFGTMGGLNRYDGDGFKTFTSVVSSPISTPNWVLIMSLNPLASSLMFSVT